VGADSDIVTHRHAQIQYHVITDHDVVGEYRARCDDGAYTDRHEWRHHDRGVDERERLDSMLLHLSDLPLARSDLPRASDSVYGLGAIDLHNRAQNGCVVEYLARMAVVAINEAQQLDSTRMAQITHDICNLSCESTGAHDHKPLSGSVPGGGHS
jgi:hypothetical protein